MLTEYLVNFSLLGAEWVLYLLLILSVVSIAFMVDRYVIYRKARQQLNCLEREMLGLPAPKGKERKSCGSSMESILLSSLPPGGGSMEILEPHLVASAQNYRRHLERFLPFLGTLGNNAPFIGLFGTVVGIIQAFFSLGQDIQGGASVVMAGISEALVATAAGIAVAIPAVVAYNFYTKSVDEFVERFEVLGRKLLMKGNGSDGKEEISEE